MGVVVGIAGPAALAMVAAAIPAAAYRLRRTQQLTNFGSILPNMEIAGKPAAPFAPQVQ